MEGFKISVTALFLVLTALLCSTGCANGQQSSYRRVCIYPNWAQYRNNDMKFFPSNVDPYRCSHLIFAFAQITNGTLDKYEWNDEQAYEELVQIRDNMNPNLKLILAVGGWNHGSERFSWMVATPENRTMFINSSIEYLRRIRFDGLDIAWEYPTLRGGVPEDKQRYTIFLQEARRAYGAEANATGRAPLLLTASFAGNPETAGAVYEVGPASQELDFMLIMSFNMHPMDRTGHQSPLHPRMDESEYFQRLNYEYLANWYRNQGADAAKFVMGFGASAKTYILENENVNGIGVPIKGPGASGVGQEPGTLYYYEVCPYLRDPNSKQNWNSIQKIPFLSIGDQWAGHENSTSIEEKGQFVKQQGLGGMMMWDLSMDDFSNSKCFQGVYPLLNAMHYALS